MRRGGTKEVIKSVWNGPKQCHSPVVTTREWLFVLNIKGNPNTSSDYTVPEGPTQTALSRHCPRATQSPLLLIKKLNQYTTIFDPLINQLFTEYVQNRKQAREFSEGTSTCLFTNIAISHREHCMGPTGMTIKKNEGPGVWSFVIRLTRGMTPHSSVSYRACNQ